MTPAPIDSSTPFRETRGHARHEAAGHVAASNAHHADLTTGEIFRLTSFRDKALSSCSQAGLVSNLNDGLAWGLFPIFFAAAGLSIGRIGVLAALYPAVWGLGQLYTGALADRIGRKPLIVVGMFTQAVAIAWIAATGSFTSWAVGALLAGILADLVSIPAAIYAVAALTAISGLSVAVRMYETHPR